MCVSGRLAIHSKKALRKKTKNERFRDKHGVEPIRKTETGSTSIHTKDESDKRSIDLTWTEIKISENGI